MGNIKKKIKIAVALMQSKVSRKRVPLFVSWIITNQCNYACAYCNPLRTRCRELSTREACEVVDELASLGTKKISFTGGEPFLRKDLGVIVRYSLEKGIVTSINSNGSLVPERIQDVLGIDVLNLSLDGPQEIHDRIRGEGSFEDVMRSAEAAKNAGIRVTFFVTLSKFNLECLNFFLQTAKDYQSLISFQPGEINALRGSGLNPHVHPRDGYKLFINDLIAAKKCNRFIGNSITGLKHLSCWPSPHPLMKCYGGKLFCRIDANGDVKICGRARGTRPAGNVLEGGFKKAFDNIERVECDLCWCAHRVEFNYVLSGNLPSLCNCIRIG